MPGSSTRNEPETTEVAPAVVADLFALAGSQKTIGGNDPLPLIDPGAVWLVTAGAVDIVAMTIVRDKESADVERTHLLRVEAGELLFGFRAPPAGHNVLLLGYGVGETRVARLPIKRLRESADDPVLVPELSRLVDRWIGEICTLCTGDLPPSGSQNIRPGAASVLEPGQSGQAQSGVLWLYPDGGSVRFMSNDDATPVEGDLLFPVSKDAWLTAEETCRLVPHRSVDVIDHPAFWTGLSRFHEVAETVIDLQRMQDHRQARRRLVEKSRATRSDLAAAFGELESVLHKKRAARVAGAGESDLLAACRLVGARLGIEIVDPGRADRRSQHVNPLEDISRSSRFALRRVDLTEDWFHSDCGPLLGFRGGGDEPIALLPSGPRSYELHSVADGSVRPVTAELARGIDPAAFMFYRCLPDRPLNGLDLISFATKGLRRDILTVVGLGAVGGLMTLVTPVAIGQVFDSVIPGAERTQLLHLALGLIIAAFATGAFHFTRNVALVRMQNRSGATLQAAIWERVVNLPAKFFRRYSAGDLGTRTMGIDKIMDVLSTSAITSIVSSIFTIFAIGLLFWYSASVAVVALGMVAIVVAVTMFCGLLQVRYEKQIEDSYGKIAGLLLQYMNGIAKIRVAAAEDRAFAQWASRFAHQRKLEVRCEIINNNLDVFLTGFPVLTYVVVFLMLANQSADPAGGISTGAFLAFISAYATLLAGMVDLGATSVNLLSVVPIYGRLKPVLTESPEIDPAKTDPGSLRGGIEVSNLTFRYDADGPEILDDVSFIAEPGEFVAIVGPSGSGKSTLLRVLLGFEQPESGSIAYDGFDAAGLDPRILRRQIGVVLQNGDLLPGDIFSNIVGSAVDLTIHDAWAAARLAGIAPDIEEMPMGMHTVISEGAGTLSGGQRQRLMIARALVTRPRIVFFDEATSALDNPTQAVITESLDRLRATRIVIAHRLSTIINADRICVLADGKLVQSGTYDELVSEEGMFLDLVRRQMA